jgi:hypothetical protein
LRHRRQSIGMRLYRCIACWPITFGDSLVGSHPYRPPITVIGATKASPPNETRFFRQRSCHNRTLHHGRRSIGMRPYRCVPMDFVRLPEGGATMIRAMTRTGRNDGSCDDALVGSHPYRPPITVIGATKASPPNETRFLRQRSCHNRTLHHGRRSIGMRPYRCVPMDFVRLPKGGAR